MCECNESPFMKLRENRPGHHKEDIQGKCDCCYKNKDAKPKGKFGVAYIIETPTRKCKPCGWEVEFSDTPSKIENNCEKMMNWITCPPLGICQNTDTKLCCSAAAKEMPNNMQIHYNSANNALCDCCKEKYTNGDYCWCKKPNKSCCCKKEINQNQCCVRENNIQEQCCCLKKQYKTKCCGVLNGQKQYLQSKNKSTKCCVAQSNNNRCCSYKKEDGTCCCKKTAKRCKCCQSDSQSSIEDCDCQNNGKRKNKNGCCCNCYACRCLGNINTQTQTRSREHNNSSVHKASTDNYARRSKNFSSFEPKPEKQKMVPKSPYTSVKEAPKKDPDKNNFYEELSKKITEMQKDGKIKTESHVENQPQEESNLLPAKELEIKNTSFESDPLEESQFEESYEMMYPETKDDETDETHKSTDNAKENEAPEVTDPASPPKKKIKRSQLLKKIKEEHKKEMQAIHPNQNAPNVNVM